MSFLSPADIAQLRTVAELPFLDDYTVLRKPETATKDSRGNRTNSTGEDFRVIEAGKGRLRASGLRPAEQTLADRLGSVVPLAFDLPLDTLITAADRLESGGRVFHVSGVIREGALAMVATAICEERS